MRLLAGTGHRQPQPPGGETADLFPLPPVREGCARHNGRPRRRANGNLTPAALAAAHLAAAKASKIDRTKYETVRTLDRLNLGWRGRRDLGVVAIDTETTSLDPMQAHLCGFSLAVADNEACYVPIGHSLAASPAATCSIRMPKLCPGQIPERDALAALKVLLEDPGVLKVGQNLKYDWLIFARRDIDLHPYDDTMLISYVLDAGRGDHGMDALSEKWLGHKPIRFQEVAGSGKGRVTFDCVSIEKAAEYAAEDADVTLRLWNALKARMPAEHVTTVYETLERPLVHGAGPHGAARRVDRPAGAVAAVRRVRAEGRGPRGRDPQACGCADQSR